jgi:hypothetical protein
VYYKSKLIIFGGEKGKDIGLSMRNLRNDLIIYDPYDDTYIHKEFDRAFLKLRIYHSGFIIDNYLYSIGGQTSGGNVLDENLEMNLSDFSFK